MVGIYCIRSGDRFYVGSSNDIEARWKCHQGDLRRNVHNPKLQAAWNKYGADAFDFEVIETCVPEELTVKEQYWIDTLDAASRANYNCCDIVGRFPSKKGIKLTDEHKAKIGNAGRGRVFSQEHRQKISDSMRGNRNRSIPSHKE